jgi:peptide deformylase
MSDVITINTGEAVEQTVETFELVDPRHPAMHKVLPEFDFANATINPTEFASTLVETCKKNHGLGLSANQCGFEHRVFVMGAGEEFVAYFNPKVISSKDEAHMEEGCLSFPFLNLKITRPKTIEVEYQDYEGVVRNKTFSGITARCFLHELDHMNGVVYTSRAKPLALKYGLKKVEKFYHKYFNPKKMKLQTK